MPVPATAVTVSRRAAPRPGPVPDRRELAAAARSLEGAPAAEVVSWAWQRFGSGLVLAASFQDCVLIDVVASAAPEVEVVFLDTQYHFPETLAYLDEVRDRYDLSLSVVRPEVEPDDRWRTDPEGCCRVRKSEPLSRALAARTAWMSGLRRVETPARSNAPVVGYDSARGVVKVNPIAAWTDDDVADYARRHRLPVHPLAGQGYVSIGCWPCTRAVADGEDPRAGRWAGTDRTECGLHL
ncbi:MAG: phosphoadenylyl-sulfate reductase [Acidimicrobiales bacterium]